MRSKFYGALSQRTSKIQIGHMVVLLPLLYNHSVRVGLSHIFPGTNGEGGNAHYHGG